jgi:hypothetical protein
MSDAPALLRLPFPADDERDSIDSMLSHLSVVSSPNLEAEQYYDGSWTATQFGISIPPSMRGLATVAGWAGTVVDVLEERLDWLGWSSDGDDFGLDEVYAANGLDVDGGQAHIDALIYGVSFVTVGAGMDGEPSPLVTPQSPKTMTGWWDSRMRRLSEALSAQFELGQAVTVTLYRPNETIYCSRRNGAWVVDERDRHRLGRVPVVAVPNRARASRQIGRSEISRAVRYYADAAARTLLGLEVNREFYNAPQRVGLNVDDSMFEDPSGAKVSPWTSIQGRIWNIPPNGDGEPEPKVMQFDPASPAPYIDQVKGYATLLAAEAGIPPAYLGFQTDNPASADAIRAGEARLVKRAERRQTSFSRSWLEVGRLALLIRDGEVPDGYDLSVSTRWRDAATPTRAAAADEAAKLIGAGVLPPNSPVTYDRVGLSPAEQRQVAADLRRVDGRGVLDTLRETASQLVTTEDAAAVKQKADAMGVLIRSGVDPIDAAEAVGFTGLKFTGAVPVSLRLPQQDATQLED